MAHDARYFAARAEIHARNPADRRRALRRRRRRRALRRTHRRDAGAARRGNDASRASSPNRNVPRRRSTGAATRLEGGKARALLVNSGNANAFTGKTGTGRRRSSPPSSPPRRRERPSGRFFLRRPASSANRSTRSKFDGVLEKLAQEARPDGWLDAARAIMTTDTYPKLSTRVATIDGVEVTISGFAKGAGMIAPDMATMLAFVFTDAAIGADALADAAVEIGAGLVQRDHRRQRHLDVGHAAAVRDGRGRGRVARPKSRRRATAGWTRSARRSTTCCSISRIKW